VVKMKKCLLVLIPLLFIILPASAAYTGVFATDFPYCSTRYTGTVPTCIYGGTLDWNQSTNLARNPCHDWVDGQITTFVAGQDYDCDNQEWGSAHEGYRPLCAAETETGGCTDLNNAGYVYPQDAGTLTSALMGGNHWLVLKYHNQDHNQDEIAKVWKMSGSEYSPAPVASFTCVPTSQYPDADIVCTDTSTNTPTSWLWSIDMEGAGIKGWQTHTGQNFTWQSHYAGLYSVNLRANNSAGSSWYNRTNYVSISTNATPNNCGLPIATGYIRTYAQTNDGMTSGGIYNSNIQLHDMEGGAWSNVTNSGGFWCIDTLPGHSLNMYAQSSGYTSTSQLGAPANGGRYYLVLWPDYIAAPSAGNVSLYTLIYDQQTGSPLYLSTVRVDGNSINTVLKNTGPEGQAVFTVKNNTLVHVTASKAGYDTITRTLTTSNLGPDTLMISLPRSTVTIAPTQTTGPGGTIPTTIGPYGTPGPGGTMAPGYTNNQGQIMMDFLARNGLSLVELCFFVTVLALLGVKLGK
jgi:PKD repeat protein